MATADLKLVGGFGGRPADCGDSLVHEIESGLLLFLTRQFKRFDSLSECSFPVFVPEAIAMGGGFAESALKGERATVIALRSRPESF
jgi:hypothetical protein